MLSSRKHLVPPRHNHNGIHQYQFLLPNTSWHQSWLAAWFRCQNSSQQHPPKAVLEVVPHCHLHPVYTNPDAQSPKHCPTKYGWQPSQESLSFLWHGQHLPVLSSLFLFRNVYSAFYNPLYNKVNSHCSVLPAHLQASAKAR